VVRRSLANEGLSLLGASYERGRIRRVSADPEARQATSTDREPARCSSRRDDLEPNCRSAVRGPGGPPPQTAGAPDAGPPGRVLRSMVTTRGDDESQSPVSAAANVPV
jgi:hypothetical protein